MRSGAHATGGAHTRAAAAGGHLADGVQPAALLLQRSAGNRAVDGLVSPPQPPPASGTGFATSPPAGLPAILRRALGDGGRPLDRPVRESMESVLGTDLRDVRVHAGAAATDAARALHANAFTVGSRVVFDDGAYAPENVHGHRLLAHELAHVVQQRSGHRGSLRAEAERDADAVSQRARLGLPAAVHASLPAETVLCDGKKDHPGFTPKSAVVREGGVDILKVSGLEIARIKSKSGEELRRAGGPTVTWQRLTPGTEYSRKGNSVSLRLVVGVTYENADVESSVTASGKALLEERLPSAEIAVSVGVVKKTKQAPGQGAADPNWSAKDEEILTLIDNQTLGNVAAAAKILDGMSEAQLKQTVARLHDKAPMALSVLLQFYDEYKDQLSDPDRLRGMLDPLEWGEKYLHVDNFTSCEVDPASYGPPDPERKKEGKGSLRFICTYDVVPPRAVIIYAEDITDDKPQGDDLAEQQETETAANGVLVPTKLNRATTPKLWEMKQRRIKEIEAQLFPFVMVAFQGAEAGMMAGQLAMALPVVGSTSARRPMVGTKGEPVTGGGSRGGQKASTDPGVEGVGIGGRQGQGGRAGKSGANEAPTTTGAKASGDEPAPVSGRQAAVEEEAAPISGVRAVESEQPQSQALQPTGTDPVRASAGGKTSSKPITSSKGSSKSGPRGAGGKRGRKGGRPRVEPYEKKIERPDSPDEAAARQKLEKDVAPYFPKGSKVAVKRIERTAAGQGQSRAVTPENSKVAMEHEFDITLPDGRRFNADGIETVGPGKYVVQEHKEVLTIWQNSRFSRETATPEIDAMLSRHGKLASDLEANGCQGFRYTTNDENLAKLLTKRIIAARKSGVPGASKLMAPDLPVE